MELCICYWNYALWNGIMHCGMELCISQINSMELCIMHIGIVHFRETKCGIMKNNNNMHNSIWNYAYNLVLCTWNYALSLEMHNSMWIDAFKNCIMNVHILNP